ncbi:MAG: ABC transporter substrate-binding protein [Phenylobacterium sp.]|nr:ABC transporter substrate-binding protein [Phenylobacterium sp.]
MLDLFSRVQLIRQAEQRLTTLFADGEVPGFIHLSIGQEGVAAGVGAALGRDDTLASNHRGHGHAIAKGLDLDRFFLEIMGRDEGYCRGRGGSMHIADMSVGMLGANGIVGAGLPIAVGSALAHQVRRTGGLATVFFGDGALAEGVVLESLNLAALWKLPLLFVCENNGWSEFSPTAKQFAADVKDLAAAFGIRSRLVDGNDAVEVWQAARQFCDEIRDGGGPRLLECMTKRVRGHFEGDPQKYRVGVDTTEMGDDDPVVRLAGRLSDAGVSDDEIQAVTARAVAAIEAAVAAGRAGSQPSFERMLDGVYARQVANG